MSDHAPPPFALVWSHDGKTIAYNRTVKTEGKEVTHIFVLDNVTLNDGSPVKLNE